MDAPDLPPPVSVAAAAAAYVIPAAAFSLAGTVVAAVRYFCSSRPPTLVPENVGFGLAFLFPLGAVLLAWRRAPPADAGARIMTGVLAFVVGAIPAQVLLTLDASSTARDALDAAGGGLVLGGVAGAVGAVLLELGLTVWSWLPRRG